MPRFRCRSMGIRFLFTNQQVAYTSKILTTGILQANLLISGKSDNFWEIQNRDRGLCAEKIH